MKNVKEHLQYIPRIVWIYIGTGLVLRLLGIAWVYATGYGDALVYGDGEGYVQLAKSLIDTGKFGTLVSGEFIADVFRTPGLPLVLAPFVATNALPVYLVLQSLIAGALLPLLVWFIGNRFFGSNAAAVAAGLSALEPNFIFFSWLPLSESLFLLTSLGAVTLYLCAQDTQKHVFLVLAGFLAGYAVLTKPGMWPIFLVVITSVALLGVWDRSKYIVVSAFVCFCAASMVVAPWMIRNHTLTGSFALSGAGWRNVYTDYLASVYALENGTMFWDEKAKLKDVTAQQFGLSRVDLGNAAYGKVLRDYAVPELWNHKETVVKLEATVLLSFFTNDSYYSYLSRFGFLPRLEGRISPTYVLLTEGVQGIPTILKELKRQWFVPILGRIFTVAMCIFALVGAFVSRRNRATWLCILVIGVWALASTVIGLGVEARLRLPIQPFLFLMAAVGIVYSMRIIRALISQRSAISPSRVVL